MDKGEAGHGDGTTTNEYGGEGGIRTLETPKGLLVFETSPIDHSGTSPAERAGVIGGT